MTRSDPRERDDLDLKDPRADRVFGAPKLTALGEPPKTREYDQGVSQAPGAVGQRTLSFALQSALSPTAIRDRMTVVLNHAPLSPLGRSRECALLDDVLSAVRRRESRSLVLRAEAGIGKTALLKCLFDSAPDLRVLRAARTRVAGASPLRGSSPPWISRHGGRAAWARLPDSDPPQKRTNPCNHNRQRPTGLFRRGLLTVRRQTMSLPTDHDASPRQLEHLT
jgi:AAA ATPase domain